jgi:outer membrane cobalamin receptor
MPTFNDLYYREVGNYKLAPEKTRQYNVGAAYSMHPVEWCREFTISTDAYYGEIKDKIVAVPGVFVWKMSNVDRVETLGADVNVKALFSLASASSLRLSSSYSYMRAVNRTAGSQIYGEQIVYTPLHSGSVDVSLSTPVVDAGYTLLWSGKRYHLAKNITSNEIDAYGDHSLWLSRRWEIGNCSLLARAEVRNISDVNYEIIRYYPMPGRNYSFTFILTL